MPNASRPLALFALLIFPAAALAQADPSQPRPERLYISPMALGAGPRVVGLAGAFVSIAERAEGLTSNVAALAQRHPLLYGNVDFDGTGSYSWFGPLPFTQSALDLDNSGQSDRLVFAQQFAASFMFQIRRFGIGAYYRTSEQGFCAIEACPRGDNLSVTLKNAGVATAFSFFADDLIVGAGLFSAQAELGYHGEAWSYGGNLFAAFNPEVDVLYRPNGRSFRLGAVYRPEALGPYYPKTSQPPWVASRQVYQAVVTPSVLSLGASMRLGKGASNYNRLSPKAREVMRDRLGEANTPAEVPYDAPTGEWLVSMQADVIFPVENAIGAAVFTSAIPVDPEPAGHGTYVVARLGVEHDTVPGRLRLRAGTWFEPSPFEGQRQRAHVTGGADLRLGHFIADWSIYTAVDMSPNTYFFYTFGVQAWQGPTPHKKPKQVERAEEEEAARRAEEAERKAEEAQEKHEEEQRLKEQQPEPPAPGPSPAPGGPVIHEL
ncbi:MAG: hypothetical protein ACYC8T_02180 [Myxococcaceae bacterium]